GRVTGLGVPHLAEEGRLPPDLPSEQHPPLSVLVPPDRPAVEPNPLLRVGRVRRTKPGVFRFQLPGLQPFVFRRRIDRREVRLPPPGRPPVTPPLGDGRLLLVRCRRAGNSL